ncbi:MAG: aldehyde dehydrogenase family protein [Candidatus Phlomobacter fragariae]
MLLTLVLTWATTPVVERATILQQAATLMDPQFPCLIGVLIREQGKTYSNAITQVREAIDFLRYYAEQISENFNNETYSPLNMVFCISPWNFSLAILPANRCRFS